MKKYLVAAAIVLSASRVFAADSLSAARDLYASASYEDALAMLGRLNAAELPPDQGRAADQYRALCLLALGKSAEASQAIEAVVAADPAYQPTVSEVSPRVRAVFSDVRKRLLPGLVQQKYAIAKAAYDHKDYVTASNGFGQLLALYADADLAPAVGKPPLSDLRTLIEGFHSLSVQAAAPRPAPEPVVVAKAPVVPKPEPVAPEPPKVYTVGDANVVPPVTIRQELPPYGGVVQRQMTGAMEVVIDETGKVVSAAMRSPTVANYDRQAVAAAQSWRYRPATLNGAPVKYRKLIQVAVTPQ
jgi:TonB family protein